MGVIIEQKGKTTAKGKGKAKATPTTVEIADGVSLAVSELEQLAERKLVVDSLKAQLKKAEGELAEVADPILEIVDTVVKPDEVLTVKTDKHVVSFNKKANQARVINPKIIPALLNKHHEGRFEQVAKVSVTDLRKYLDPEELEEVMVEEPTKKRVIKVAAIGS